METREAIYNPDTRTWVAGDQLAYRGKKGCRNATCTRRDFRDADCWGWHCARCHEPCSSQGHECGASPRQRQQGLDRKGDHDG